MRLDGSCHCGAITLAFAATRSPGDLPVRTCGCTFCRKHRPRYTSDPAGHVAFRIGEDGVASRYRFGLRLADFLICRRCGVFVGALEPGQPGRAVINVEALARADELTAVPTTFTAYDSEDVATRAGRRARAWTPADLQVGEGSIRS